MTLGLLYNHWQLMVTIWYLQERPFTQSDIQLQLVIEEFKLHQLLLTVRPKQLLHLLVVFQLQVKLTKLEMMEEPI
jgi:hypothetical protein